MRRNSSAVVGVAMGDERAGVRAAVDGLQDGRLHLQVAARVHLLADRADDVAAQPGHPAGFRVDDQVHVALAHPRLDVGEALVLVRQRPEAFRSDHEPVGEHRELAAARGDHLARHPDVVAEIDVPLPGRQRLVADLGQRDHDLNVTGAVADGGEAQLAADARQHHAAGDADLVPGRRVRRQVRRTRPGSPRSWPYGESRPGRDRRRLSRIASRLPLRTRICSGRSAVRRMRFSVTCPRLPVPGRPSARGFAPGPRFRTPRRRSARRPAGARSGSATARVHR